MLYGRFLRRESLRYQDIYDDHYEKNECGCCNRRHDEAGSEELKTMECINTARIADSGNSKNTINAGSKSL